MLPYFALIALSLAGGPLLSTHPEYRRKFLLVFGLACWGLASLRYVTGFDYRSYEAIFQKIAGQDLACLTAREPGYFLLNWTAALWGGNYRAFLFLVHLLVTALVLLWVERHSSAPWLSVYLFVTLQYFAMSMNLLRQSIAAAIVLWTYPFLQQRRLLPFCGVVLLAFCFHQSALLMLPLSIELTGFQAPLRNGGRHSRAGLPLCRSAAPPASCHPAGVPLLSRGKILAKQQRHLPSGSPGLFPLYAASDPAGSPESLRFPGTGQQRVLQLVNPDFYHPALHFGASLHLHRLLFYFGAAGGRLCSQQAARQSMDRPAGGLLSGLLPVCGSTGLPRRISIPRRLEQGGFTRGVVEKSSHFEISFQKAAA